MNIALLLVLCVLAHTAAGASAPSLAAVLSPASSTPRVHPKNYFPVAGATPPRPSPSPVLRRPQRLQPPLPPPPPPPRPRPPHPPPRPPQPLQPLAEAGWLLWVRHLHALTRFGSPPVGPDSTPIHKLLPATFWYSLLATDDVPGSLRATDAVRAAGGGRRRRGLPASPCPAAGGRTAASSAPCLALQARHKESLLLLPGPAPVQADIWANTLMAYDPLWLRPQRSLLSDTFIGLLAPAKAAKLVPAGAAGSPAGCQWGVWDCWLVAFRACMRACLGPQVCCNHSSLAACMLPAARCAHGCRSAGVTAACLVSVAPTSPLPTHVPSPHARSCAERAGPSHKSQQQLCRPRIHRDGAGEPQQRVCAHHLPRLGLQLLGLCQRDAAGGAWGPWAQQTGGRRGVDKRPTAC